jgi:chemotaxis protein CheY-P-specific phosphatase CheC
MNIAKLNADEMVAANGIVNAGLIKAAESLSFFMKEEIILNQITYEAPDALEYQRPEKADQTMLVLMTEIIGELKGICCLIFSENEADRLRNAALPPEVKNNPAMMVEMNDAILLEVDNIISAAVVTQFSNYLGKRIHGGVPHLKLMKPEQLNKFLEGNVMKDLFEISFKVNFVSKCLNFSPEFLWLFDEKFIEAIKIFSNDLDKVRKLMGTQPQSPKDL